VDQYEGMPGYVEALPQMSRLQAARFALEACEYTIWLLKILFLETGDPPFVVQRP